MSTLARNCFKRLIGITMGLGLISLSSGVVVLPAQAAVCNPGQAGDPLCLTNIKNFGLPTGGTSKVATIIVTAINILLGLVSVLALAALIWGGIKYITSFGDEHGASQGKNVIKYAITGLLVAIASFVIIRAVMAILR